MSVFTDHNARDNWLATDRDNLAFVFLNRFPNTPAHLLICTQDDSKDTVFECTRDEIMALYRLSARVITAYEKNLKTDGYTIGWNIGEAAGRSIAHNHLHIAPRFHWHNDQHKIESARPGIAGLPFPAMKNSKFPYYGDQTFAVSYDKAVLRPWNNDQQAIPIVAQNRYAFAIEHPYPVTPGHLAILPRRRALGFLQLSGREFLGTVALAKTLAENISDITHSTTINTYGLDHIIPQIIEGKAVDGVNLGWDIGEAAGQIGQTLYAHFIPRRTGDITGPDKAGGLVQTLPDNKYLQALREGKTLKSADGYTVPLNFDI